MNKRDPTTVQARWNGHLEKCANCQRYEEANTATLRHLCLDGAVLMKELLESRAAPVMRRRGRVERAMYRQVMGQNDFVNDEPRIVSKERVKKITRYVGDL
jgi:hypothetical protein